MDPAIFLAAVIAVASLAAAAVVQLRYRTAAKVWLQTHATLQEQLTRALSEVEAAKKDVREIGERNVQLTRDAATAETRLSDADRRLAELNADLKSAVNARDEAAARATEAEKSAALAQQAVAEIQRRLADWESAKKQSQEAANAAMLQTATVLSNKLIEDHKRETATAKEESEKTVTKAREEFAKQVTGIAESVATLNNLVAENRTTVETIVKAISTPAAAGESAQLGLENRLKSFGLERGRDFVMEYSITDGETKRRLRPDAVVFLPAESVLVIDSKASKFLYEIATTEGTEDEAAAYAKFAMTMNAHLRSLADKDYRGAILDAYRRTGRQGEIKRIVSVMAVPNDSSLERLMLADPDFARKAAQYQIIPTGPAGLACMIGFARIEIDAGRQIENQEKIVIAAQRLLDGIAIALGHASSVGNSIKSAADHFAKFAGSVNKTLLPRAKALPSLGVRPEKKPLPANLPAIQVIGFETHTTIEGELGEDEAPGLPPPS